MSIPGFDDFHGSSYPLGGVDWGFGVGRQEVEGGVRGELGWNVK